MQTIQFHEMTLTWLDSTIAVKDGGPVMGPVVKPVWTRRYPYDKDYNIQTNFSPILIQYQGDNYLIDTGLNTEKFTPKKYRNLSLQYEDRLMESLKEIGLKSEDIDYVLMTHLHDDHASGLTGLNESGQLISRFPKAKVYVTAKEWENVQNPSSRSAGTYLEENWQPIQEQVITFQDAVTVNPGIEMFLAPGHTEGMAVIRLTQGDEVYFHFSDLQQVTANIMNPLWISAFDDYPMDSVASREYWLPLIRQGHYTLFFYHDPYYATIQFDEDGHVIDHVLRDHTQYIPWPDSIPYPHVRDGKS